MKLFLFHSLFALLFLLTITGKAPAQGGQYNFRGIPATIEEVDLGLPDKGKFNGQIDLQIVTQGTYFGENANPFAYWQRASFDAVVTISSLLALLAFSPRIDQWSAQRWRFVIFLAALMLVFWVLFANSLKHAKEILSWKLQSIEQSAPY